MLTRRVILACLLLCTVFSGVGRATGFIETPSPLDDYRQEVGVFAAETDLEARKTGFPDLSVRQRGAYVQVELPFAEVASFYVRAGGADARVEADSGGSFVLGETLAGKVLPWGGVGVKGVIGTHPHLNLGYYVEGGYYGRSKDTVAAVDYELNDYWDATVALAVQAQYAGFGVYVGPFAHVAGAKLEVDDGTAISSSNYRGESQGVQAGVKIPLGTLAYLSLDGQFGERTLWGGSINFVGLDF